MILRAFLLLAMLALPQAAAAQAQPGALARVIVQDSAITDTSNGARIDLRLSQGVPFRVFTLTGPNRLVADFRTIDWAGVTPDALLGGQAVTALRTGPYRADWSRMVAELAAPMTVETAGLRVDTTSGIATLTIDLVPASQEAMAKASGAPDDPNWDLPAPSLTAEPRARKDRLLVMIDPGHGGIDPGAEAGNVSEADLMLTFARDLGEVLLRAGYDVAYTRETDEFVSLDARVARAQAVGADLFLSLHADALAEGTAQGAAVYTLSDTASDRASAALAERHDRENLLAGADLSGTDDQVTGILLDLARLDNTPRSEALATHLIDGIRGARGRVHKRPLRKAGFSVLKAAAIPSVLVEVGFLSTEAELARLRDPVWRGVMAQGLRDGIEAWALEDASLARLRRQ